MSRLVGALPILLAGVLISTVCPAQTPPARPPGVPPPPRDTSAIAATAIIRGHVFDASTGQPLRKVLVRAIAPELRENRVAITDNSGSYEIKDMVAGRYTLNASKGSFVALQYGQTRPFEPGKPLEVHDAQLLDKVDFRLPRGGIITGRVVDETGEPTSDVQVAALRYSYVNGRRQLGNVGRTATTNDIGEFRIFALPPGEYFLSATLRGGLSPLDSGSNDRAGYAPTYFPGTPNVTEAQRITIGVGQALSDINIALSPTKLARISGVALDSNGRPLVGATVNAMLVNGLGLSTTRLAQVRPDGSFTVSGVAPGDYVLRVNSSVASGSPPDVAQANVTVIGDDISDVTLAIAKAITVTGRVIPPPQSANISFAGMQLLVSPATPMPLLASSIAKVKDDGTFLMQVTQPGVAFLRMNTVGPLANIRIKSIRVNGIETIDTGIDFKPSQNLDGVEIELTSQVSTLSGVVTDAKGNSVKDYTVVIFARDRSKWTFGSRFFNTGRPDQDGRYKAMYLPPGEYYAIALDYVEQGANTDPEFLDRLKDRAAEFSMTEGESKALDLRLITGM